MANLQHSRETPVSEPPKKYKDFCVQPKKMSGSFPCLVHQQCSCRRVSSSHLHCKKVYSKADFQEFILHEVHKVHASLDRPFNPSALRHCKTRLRIGASRISQVYFVGNAVAPIRHT